MQALLLALQIATIALSRDVGSEGEQVTWLDDQERVILARQGISRASHDVILALLANLKMVAAILDSGDDTSRAQRKQAMAALASLGGSVGQPPVWGKRRKSKVSRVADGKKTA